MREAGGGADVVLKHEKRLVALGAALPGGAVREEAADHAWLGLGVGLGLGFGFGLGLGLGLGSEVGLGFGLGTGLEPPIMPRVISARPSGVTSDTSCSADSSAPG